MPRPPEWKIFTATKSVDIHRFCPCFSAFIKDASLWSVHGQLEDLLPPSPLPFRAFCHYRLGDPASRPVSHSRVVAMNAYDDLPPLSLATLGSPIRTIYSSKKPMRIQSYWSLCSRQVVSLQKLRVRSTFFSTTTRTALSIALYT